MERAGRDDVRLEPQRGPRPIAGRHLIPPSLRDGYVDALRRFLDALDAPVVGKRVTVTVRDRSGRECPMEMTVTAMRLGSDVYCGAFLQRA